MSEEEIKIEEVVSGLEKCKLVIRDEKVVLECPKEAVAAMTKTVVEDGVLIREVKVEVEGD